MIRNNTRAKVVVLAAVSSVLLGLGNAASASSLLSFSTNAGSLPLNATADFNLDSSTHILSITLTNKSTAATSNGQLLTGLLWNSAVNVGGSLSSVDLAAAVGWGSPGTMSVVLPSGGDTGVFGYSAVGTAFDVTSTGAIPFGAKQDLIRLTNAPKPQNGNSPDGPDGALIGTGAYSDSSGNNIIKNSLTYKITGVNSAFQLSNITNVTFYYGTGSGGDVGSVTGSRAPTPVPLPAAVWSGLSLLGGIGLFGKFRKRAVA